MGEQASAAAELTAALRQLNDAAGRPGRAALVRWGTGQEPPVKLTEQTLSDWFSSTVVSVPADESTLLALVAHLETTAVKSGYRRRSPAWWTRLRAKAWAETHVDPGGRPPVTRPARPGIPPGPAVSSPPTGRVRRPAGPVRRAAASA